MAKKEIYYYLVKREKVVNIEKIVNGEDSYYNVTHVKNIYGEVVKDTPAFRKKAISEQAIKAIKIKKIVAGIKRQKKIESYHAHLSMIPKGYNQLADFRLNMIIADLNKIDENLKKAKNAKEYETFAKYYIKASSYLGDIFYNIGVNYTVPGSG